MAIGSIYNFEEEMVVFLRNSDIIPTGTRAVTTRVETKSGDGTTTVYAIGSTPVRNMRSVVVGTGSLNNGTGYSVNYQTGSITFVTAPASGASNISMQYDFGLGGSGDSIYADYPRSDLKLDSYPRVSAGISNWRTSPFGFGGSLSFVSDFIFTVSAFASGTQGVDNILTTARRAIATSGTKFFGWQFIHPQTLSPIMQEPERDQKILVRHQDFQVLKHVEY